MKQVMFAVIMILLFSSFTGRRHYVKLAFQNNTGKDIKTLKVNIRGREFSFTNVHQGTLTKVILVPETYAYCYAKAITAKDTLICQPTDFVGEKLYRSGGYVMKLFLIQGQKYMRMEFEPLPATKP